MTTKRGSKKVSSPKRAISRPSKMVAQDRKKTVIVIGVFALIIIIGLVIYFPLKNPGSKTGVGADGYTVFEIKGADLGAGNIIKREAVQEQLGNLAKSVDDTDVSGVISLNGVKGQTATFYIETKAGTKGSVYIDKWEYKNKRALDADNLFAGTGDAGKVGDLPIAYLHAVTVANEREYALIMTKGVKSYKFALTQPFNNITIDEVTAHKALKRIAEKSNL